MGARNSVSNVLLLGETGSGKSTFINYLANIFAEGSLHKPNVIIPNEIYPCQNVPGFTHSDVMTDDPAQSRTQKCTVYSFQSQLLTFSFIDTPGFNDNFIQSERNIEQIVKAVSQTPSLRAIIVMIDGSNASLHRYVRDALSRVYETCPGAVENNLILMFTKCAQLPKQFVFDFKLSCPSKLVSLNNLLFSVDQSSLEPEDLPVLQAKWKKSKERIIDLLNFIDKLQSHSTEHISESTISNDLADMTLTHDTTPVLTPRDSPGAFTVLVIGDKGAGKSTYINYAANILQNLSLDRLQSFVPMKETTECSTYVFEGVNRRYTFIDTPGLTGVDAVDIERTLECVCQAKSLNAVILVLAKKTMTQGAAVRDAMLKQLSEICPDAVRTNLIAIITNCDFVPAKSNQIPWHFIPSKLLYMENSAFANMHRASNVYIQDNQWRKSKRQMIETLNYIEGLQICPVLRTIPIQQQVSVPEEEKVPAPVCNTVSIPISRNKDLLSEQAKTQGRLSFQSLFGSEKSEIIVEDDVTQSLDEPLPQEPQLLNILLLEEVGASKSAFLSWLNFFFDMKSEEASTEGKVYKFQRENVTYAFLDTPELSARSTSQKVNQILKVALQVKELYAVVLLVNAASTDVNSRMKTCLDSMHKASPHLLQHNLIVVVTNYRQGQLHFNVKNLKSRPAKTLLLGNFQNASWDGLPPEVAEANRQNTLEELEKAFAVISNLIPQETRAFQAVTSPEPIAAIPRPQLNSAASEPLSILLIGETGAGKSTFINYLANYFLGGSLDEMKIVIPNHIYKVPNIAGYTSSENCVENRSESQTNSCTSYTFTRDSKSYKFIDTPGFSDTRGGKQDDKNIELILQAALNARLLSAIIIIINGTAARLTVNVRNVLTKIAGNFPDILLDNLIVIYTMCSSAGQTFDESSLPRRPKLRLSMNNSAFCSHPSTWKERDRVEIGLQWDTSYEHIEHTINFINTLAPQSTMVFENMLQNRREIQTKIHTI